jgi:hypothetical protein
MPLARRAMVAMAYRLPPQVLWQKDDGSGAGATST